MKNILPLSLLITVAVFISAADKPNDITGKDAATFNTHVGQVISLQGRLENGKPGMCLWGATPDDVWFYVIPDMPSSGIYNYPERWMQLIHKQVRLTGELKFRSFDRSKKYLSDQVPRQESPDYFYMVLQRTTIERIESK